MFIHDVIKMLYISEGYLQGYTYYLISDREMFDAFLKSGGFFDTFYPCPSDDLQEQYNTLRQYIVARITAYLAGEESNLPDWIYSYMLMRPITFQSDEADIDYLNELAGVDIVTGSPVFTAETAEACYEVSKRWIQKQPVKYIRRPPTVFGETHVTKSLRLAQSNVLAGAEGI